MKKTLRRVIEKYNLPVIITPNQNLVLRDLDPAVKDAIAAELKVCAWGVLGGVYGWVGGVGVGVWWWWRVFGLFWGVERGWGKIFAYGYGRVGGCCVESRPLQWSSGCCGLGRVPLPGLYTCLGNGSRGNWLRDGAGVGGQG